MLNKAQIIGHLGRDPEVRYLPGGDAVANIAIATTEKWKDKNSGDMMEATEWHRVSFFGRLAEVVGEYLKKGALVYVEGKIKTRKYTDKDGVEKYATEINGYEMKMLGGRPQQDDQQGRQAAPQQRQSAPQGNGSQQRPAQRQGGQVRQPAAQKTGAAGNGFDDMDDSSIPF